MTVLKNVRNRRASKLEFLLKKSVLCCLMLSELDALAKTVTVKGDSPVDSASLVEKWMAVGSGCQATSDKAGDVKFVGVDVSKSKEDVNRNDALKGSPKLASLKFDLSQFSLRPLVKKDAAQREANDPASTSSERNAGTSATEARLVNYARECAIRVVVAPPPGTKIRSVNAKAVAEVTKDRHSKMLLQGSLKVGASTVAKAVHQFGSDQEFRFRSEVLEAVPGSHPDDEVAPIACNEKKVVGFDLTFLTNKENASAVAEARLAANSLVTLDLELEDCVPSR